MVLPAGTVEAITLSRHHHPLGWQRVTDVPGSSADAGATADTGTTAYAGSTADTGAEADAGATADARSTANSGSTGGVHVRLLDGDPPLSGGGEWDGNLLGGKSLTAFGPVVEFFQFGTCHSKPVGPQCLWGSG
jgi:hypothetical protein